MPDDEPSGPRVPRRLRLPRQRLSSWRVGRAYRAAAKRPSDPEGHTHPAPAEVQDDEITVAQTRPLMERRASALLVACFTLAVLGSLLFCAAYLWIPHGPGLGLTQNLVVGTGLGVAMAGISVGLILLAKTTMPPVQSEQEREPHPAPKEDERAAETQVIEGYVETGLAHRKFVRRSLLAALGVLPLPFLFSLRDTGPRPHALLRENAWGAGDRLVDSDTRVPVKLGDLDIGGIVSVMPEGHLDSSLPVAAESAVVLIRLPPGVNRPLPGREDWAPYDHVAYSKTCTHAGCPVSLYDKVTSLLLCPCHQSTFDVPRGCDVVFGPAARPLPQLPIHVDAAGYFRATSTFDVPLGPSYWSRP